IGTIRFDPGMPGYALNLGSGRTLDVTGQGIVNNLSFQPTILADGNLNFLNGSSAANSLFNAKGKIHFADTSSAGSANFLLSASSPRDGAEIRFDGASTAANAIIVSLGAGNVSFRESATAANAQFRTENGSALGVSFEHSSTAGSASFTTGSGGQNIDVA